jgi:hypothetical protein
MLSTAQVESTLLFCAIASLAIGVLFRGTLNDSAKRKSSLFKVLLVVVLSFVVKLVSPIFVSIKAIMCFICCLHVLQQYDLLSMEPNLYVTIESGRHSSTIEMRKAYKLLSKTYHPDKNPSEDAIQKFQEVKLAYDVSLFVVYEMTH